MGKLCHFSKYTLFAFVGLLSSSLHNKNFLSFFFFHSRLCAFARIRNKTLIRRFDEDSRVIVRKKGDASQTDTKWAFLTKLHYLDISQFVIYFCLFADSTRSSCLMSGPALQRKIIAIHFVVESHQFVTLWVFRRALNIIASKIRVKNEGRVISTNSIKIQDMESISEIYLSLRSRREFTSQLHNLWKR